MIGRTGGNDRRESQVLALFDEERDVLLDGPMTALAPLVARREALIGELLADPENASPAFLAAIRTRAERNGRLLRASIAGIRAAQAQIEAAERESQSLVTYTAAGASVQVTAAPNTRDRRR